MLRIADAWNQGHLDVHADRLAGNIMAWAYTLLHIQDLFPERIMDAYLATLQSMVDQMLVHAPRDVNTNMDCREIVVLALMDKLYAGDPERHEFFVTSAKRILFGDETLTAENSNGVTGIFHPAGYIGEANGPETTYNGVSLYYLVEAGLITHGDPDWDSFLGEVIDRMLRFKAFNSFPDPDGSYRGPSSWSKRTNGGYPQDQRARPYRNVGAAMLSDEALFIVGEVNGRSELLETIQENIGTLNFYHKQAFENAKNNSFDEVELDYKWPEGVPYSYDFYVEGGYEKLRTAYEETPNKFRPPFGRPEDFSVCFDREFWIAKSGDSWGFQIETVSDMGWGYNQGNSGALAGGSLAAFWSKDAGTVILGKLPDKFNKVTWDSVEQWTSNHIWGFMSDGSPFSSARNWYPNVNYDNELSPNYAQINGVYDENTSRSDPNQILFKGISYNRTFVKGTNILQVNNQLSSSGNLSVRELWETIPIFIGNNNQDNENDTMIEFRIGNVWRALDTSDNAIANSNNVIPGQLYRNVTAFRFKRFGNSVRINLDLPRSAKMGSARWEGAYQSNEMIHNLMLSYLEDSENEQLLPAVVSLTYEIKVESK